MAILLTLTTCLEHVWPSQSNLFYTFTVYRTIEQSSDRTRVYAAISSTAWPVFASDTALQRGCFLSSPLRFAHCSMGTQRPPFCSLCVETSGPSPPPAGFRQELDWVLSYKHEVVVAQTSACPGSTGVSGHMHSSSPKIQREG